MHDSNGKRLQAGSEFYTYKLGMCKVLSIASDGKSMCAQAYKGGDGLEYTQNDFIEAFPDVVYIPTWKELAAKALLSSNACNLTGVVKDFAIVANAVRHRLEHERQGGTEAVNNHPVCVIFAQAIGNMTGCESISAFSRALDWAHTQ